MGLSCECGDHYEWWYAPHDDYNDAERDSRCCSCNAHISTGDTVLGFSCWEADEDGNEIYGPDKWHCEGCADLFLSLTAAGFCIDLGDDMRELHREYLADYSPPKMEIKR